MRNTSIAESLLSLCTSRERANSIVGDLSEEASSRGWWWFWSQVLGTLAALVWRDLRGAPWRIVALGILGLFLVAFQGYWAPLGWMMIFGWGPPPGVSMGMYGLWIASVVCRVTITPFLVGLLLARLSAGRELASCIVFPFVCQLVWVIALAGFLWNRSTADLTADQVQFFARHIGINLFLFLPSIAAAATVRRWTLAKRDDSCLGGVRV